MIRRIGSWLAPAALFGLAAWAVISLPDPFTGLTRDALAEIDRAGVSNPVTAVLLNYRSYDTLLETAVLLAAIVAIWSLRSVPTSSFARPASPILVTLLRLLLPLLLLSGGYLLWTGAFAPGGAFQGGALLGGALVLMLLGGLLSCASAFRIALLRTGLWLGPAVFITVGLGVMGVGGNLLQYPVPAAGSLILLIEAAALVSIALTLAALFLGGRPDLEAIDKQAEEP